MKGPPPSMVKGPSFDVKLVRASEDPSHKPAPHKRNSLKGTSHAVGISSARKGEGGYRKSESVRKNPLQYLHTLVEEH